MRFLLLIPLLLLAYCSHAQNSGDDSVTNRIVLIGDAGALVNGQAPVMQAVRKLVPLDKKTTVIFLGDNLYRQGLPDEQMKIYSSKRIVLDSQIALVQNTAATGYMIPGNHDWQNGGAGGYAAILREQQYVDAISSSNFTFYPKDGCPGPVAVNIGNNIVLIMMDSQWWLQTGPKPGIESDCPFKTRSEVLAEIEDILVQNPKKLIVFACHHPFRSNGYHGGYFGWKQHIFPFRDLNKSLYIPLPVLGSIYPISRSVFGSPQDLKHPTYANMADSIQDVVKQHPNVIFVAGHEHTLQYFPDSNFHYIVSGSGCKNGRVEDTKKSEFALSALGFSTLEVSKNKNVRLTFYTTSPDSSGVAFTKNILNFSTPSTLEDTVPATLPVYIYKDSALVAASDKYNKTTKLQHYMMGDNYRTEWTTPIKMKVFNINKEKGGFKITGMGGGRQTRALTLVDKKGVEWRLRTTDKENENFLPPEFGSPLSGAILSDMISASYPYAPLIAEPLARAVNVSHVKAEYFFVPDDPALGFYQRLFANKVVTLERKTPLSLKANTRSTAKLLNKMIEDNDHVVDQQEVLKARLLDMVMADWDRHFDQWTWEVGDTGKGKVYYPIPKDRDEAFFYSDGQLIKFLTRNKLPFLKGFREDIPKINWLNYRAKDFDRIFLNDLDQKEWKTTIASFQRDLSDSAIDKSVKSLPMEIYNLSGPVIADKLKSRRDLLMKKGLSYFNFISKYVNVLGSNKKEYFKVTGNDSGLLVQVYARDQEKDTSFLKYSRQFDPAHTKEIRLYGFNDNDIFTIDADRSPIKVRMIGGRGDDTFQVTGAIKNYIYDLSTEQNVIHENSRYKNRLSANPSVNDYNYQEYKYPNMIRFPWINGGANSEDGPMLGLGFWRKTYGFRKEPYASEVRLTTLYSFPNKAYQIKYFSAFVNAINNLDIVLNAQYINPTLLNFYGLGNETKKLPEVDRTFYRTKYKYLAGDFLLRKTMFGKLQISAGPSFSYYWIKNEENQNHVLSRPELVGLSYPDVYSRKTYLGGKVNVSVNNLNNDFFPTRGVDWNNEFVYLGNLNNNGTPLSRFRSDMAVHASLTDPAKLVAVLRLGGGHIFNPNFEYFQALSLGANNYLRGFRKNRFSGSSMFYTSLELWYKLKDVQSYIIPGSFGIVGFNDLGRVWMRGENSHKWHDGYGGGLYYMPFNIVIVSATAGISEEEVLFNFTIGTKLNLTF